MESTQDATGATRRKSRPQIDPAVYATAYVQKNGGSTQEVPGHPGQGMTPWVTADPPRSTRTA